jgi:tetraacyldisaccharide 4'-kinase
MSLYHIVARSLPQHWNSRYHPIILALLPFTLVYCIVVYSRLWLYRMGFFKINRVAVPVIVIGNITVGGTGKTPMTIWLSRWLKQQGWQPGIVSRGYGAYRLTQSPRIVPINGTAEEYSDEALLLARRTNCPVMIAKDRAAAAHALVRDHDCHIIVSDDGLQHERLHRDVTLILIDAHRQWSNGYCLPAGPLREQPHRRLKNADFVLITGTHKTTIKTNHQSHWSIRFHCTHAQNMADSRLTSPLNQFAHQPVIAIAGIAYPERFFAMLEQQGLSIHRRCYVDHHLFTQQDVEDWPANTPVLMTEKDAVKCQAWATAWHWFVPLIVEPEATFIGALQQRLLTL